MSNIDSIGVIAAIFVSGAFLHIHAARAQTEAGHQILTGVTQGLAMSVKDRWLMLYQVYVPRALYTLVFLFFLAMAFWTAASGAGDERLKSLAYLGAAICIFGCVGHLLFSVSAFLGYASALREGKGRQKEQR